MKYERNRLIQAKPETSYGTPLSGWTGADAFLVVGDPDLRPLEGGTVTRDYVRGYLGGQEKVHVNKHASLNFSVELTGAGAYVLGAGSAIGTPTIGMLLKACGMAETAGKIDAGDAANSKMDYTPMTPTSANEGDSVQFRVFYDGVLQTLVGCRGTWELTADVNTIPRITFTFMGRFAAPVDTANPTGDFSRFANPDSVSDASADLVSLHGETTLCYTALSLTWGATVNHRERVGDGPRVLVSPRNTTGRIRLDHESIGTWSPIDIASRPVAAANTGLTVALGGSLDSDGRPGAGETGLTVVIDAPKVQISEPTYPRGGQSGVQQVEMMLGFLPLTGNDDLTLSFR